MTGKHTRKRGFGLRRVAIAVHATAAVCSGAMFALDMLLTDREDAANLALQQQVHALTLPSPAADAESAPVAPKSNVPDGDDAPETPQMLPHYAALWQENLDLTSWLTIEGTRIDYPVPYTLDDPEHYLRRAFDGSSAVSGSLFLDADCTPSSSCAIVYGHNMNSPTKIAKCRSLRIYFHMSRYRRLPSSLIAMAMFMAMFVAVFEAVRTVGVARRNHAGARILLPAPAVQVVHGAMPAAAGAVLLFRHTCFLPSHFF